MTFWRFFWIVFFAIGVTGMLLPPLAILVAVIDGSYSTATLGPAIWIFAVGVIASVIGASGLEMDKQNREDQIRERMREATITERKLTEALRWHDSTYGKPIPIPVPVDYNAYLAGFYAGFDSKDPAVSSWAATGVSIPTPGSSDYAAFMDNVDAFAASAKGAPLNRYVQVMQPIGSFMVGSVLPVGFFSGPNEARNLQRLLALGAVKYVDKPEGCVDEPMSPERREYLRCMAGLSTQANRAAKLSRAATAEWRCKHK